MPLFVPCNMYYCMLRCVKCNRVMQERQGGLVFAAYVFPILLRGKSLDGYDYECVGGCLCCIKVRLS